MRSSSLSVPLLATGAYAVGDLSRAETAFNTLQQWYNQQQGLWNTCGWWNGANCMTAISELANIDSSIKSQAISVFSTTYQNAPGYNPSGPVTKEIVNGQVVSKYPARVKNDNVASPAATGGNAAGFLDSCYDDNGWWALAWMYAYDLTGEQNYLATAQGIFQNMTGVSPSPCGNGGIIWCAPPANVYVNAIANELYLEVAASLASRVPDQKSYYQGIAENQWTWFKGQDFFNGDGTINDGLDENCKNNGQAVWSYNQGVILGALVELNKLNGDASLLSSAADIAKAAITHLTDSNHVVHDYACEPNCAPDGTQFKGIFIRNLAKLHQAAPDALYEQVINASANAIWDSDRTTDSNQFSTVWSGPIEYPVNASTHSSAFEAIIAQALIG